MNEATLPLQLLVDEFNRFLQNPAATRRDKKAAADRLKAAVDARLLQLECDCDCSIYQPMRFNDGSLCPCICHDPEPDLAALNAEREERYRECQAVYREALRLAGYRVPEPDEG